MQARSGLVDSGLTGKYFGLAIIHQTVTHLNLLKVLFVVQLLICGLSCAGPAATLGEADLIFLF